MLREISMTLVISCGTRKKITTASSPIQVAMDRVTAIVRMVLNFFSVVKKGREVEAPKRLKIGFNK